MARVIARITHTRHYSTGNWVKESKKTPKGVARTSGRTIAFFGRDGSAQVAASLFSQWIPAINFMARQATSNYFEELVAEHNFKMEQLGLHGKKVTSAYHIHGLGDAYPNVYRASWLAGCLRGINDKLSEQERSRDSQTSTALAVFDAKLLQEYQEFSKGFTTTKTSGNRKFNAAGYSSGMVVGSSLQIGQSSISAMGAKELDG